MIGPGEALSFAAIGHIEDRPRLIYRAAVMLALHFEVDPKDVRRALSDPTTVRAAMEHVVPEAARLVYGPGSD